MFFTFTFCCICISVCVLLYPILYYIILFLLCMLFHYLPKLIVICITIMAYYFEQFLTFTLHFRYCKRQLSMPTSQPATSSKKRWKYILTRTTSTYQNLIRATNRLRQKNGPPAPTDLTFEVFT